MKVRFWMDQCYPNEKTLTIEMQMIHRGDLDQIYSTAYKLDIRDALELSMFTEILRGMERNTCQLAAEKLNLMKVVEHRHILHLEERIRHLEKMLTETTGMVR